MADLEAVAKWCEGMAAREDAAAASASGAEFHSEAREYRRQAAMHRAASAACRELAKRHALPKHKQNAICWEPSMSGLPHDKEVADIVLARRDTDAALAEIE